MKKIRQRSKWNYPYVLRHKKIASIVHALSLIIIYKCGFFTSLIADVLMSALIRWHLFINSPIKKLSRKFSLKAYLSSYLHTRSYSFSFLSFVHSSSCRLRWFYLEAGESVRWETGILHRFFLHNCMYRSYSYIGKVFHLEGADSR